MGHTKPDIAYALNVLSRYCNNPGRRHVEFLLCLVKYCEYSKDDRLKFPSTCSTIPFGAIIPSGVAIHSMKSLLPGVTRYAPTRSPPRSVSPYSADNAKNTLIDVAATLPQYVSSGL